MRRLLVASALGALLCAAAPATVYYVRTPANGGSNANPGTSPGLAWATVQQAANSMSAGDTVYVGAGTYSQASSIVIAVSGAVGQPISYVADTDGAQTGDAGTVLLDNTGTGSTIEIAEGVDDLVFDGFDITNQGGSLARGIWGQDGCDRIVVRGCHVYQCGATGIAFGVSTTNPATCVDILIEDCIVHDNGVYGINIYGRDDLINNATVSNNLVYANTQGIRVERIGDVLIEGNIVHSQVSTNSPGIMMPNTNGTALIRNNIVYANAPNGEGIDLNNVTAVICNNTSYGNRDGIETNGTSGGFTAYNNIVFGNTSRAIDHNGVSLVWDYNCYNGTREGLPVGQGANDVDATDLAASDLFVNYDGVDNILGGANADDDDFRLADGAPVIDAGADTSIHSAIPSTDFEGGTRPSSSGTDNNGPLADYDIGADEYGAMTVGDWRDY